MLRFEVVWVVVWKAADDKSSNIQKKPKFPETCFEIAMKQLWDFMILLQPDLEAAATDFGRDLGSWEWDQHLLLPTLLVRASSKQSSRSFVISRCIIASSYYAASGHNLMLYFFSSSKKRYLSSCFILIWFTTIFQAAKNDSKNAFRSYLLEWCNSILFEKCLILIYQLHGVWKSRKKYHALFLAKRASFTFWEDKSSSKMPKMKP